MRLRPPRRHPPVFLLAFALLLPAVASPAAASPPPVPGKQGGPPPRHSPVTLPPGEDAATAVRSALRSPALGTATYSVLAIRAAFSDTPVESSTAYYDRVLLFARQYWEQVSNGQVVLDFTLAPSVVTLPQPMSYYGDDNRFQERLVHMVRDVVAAADPTVDFRPYEGLVIFHAGRGQEADVLNNSRDQIWSAFVTRDDISAVLPDSTGAVGIATNDEVSPGVPYRVKEAVELPESESQDGYLFGMTGVVAHELGHLVGVLRTGRGMPDLYDTDGDEGGANQGLGPWDLMASGVWNFNGFVPSGLSAWSRAWLGISPPARVSASSVQALGPADRPVGVEPSALMVPITQSEYFMVENRIQDRNGDGRFNFDDADGDSLFDFYVDSYAGAEYDFFLPGGRDSSGALVDHSGILIYHVDESVIEGGLLANVVNGTTARKGVDLEEADGVEDLDRPDSGFPEGGDGEYFRLGRRDRFGPETRPSSDAYDAARSGIVIRVTAPQDSVDTLAISFERIRSGWPKILTNARVRNVPPLAADLDGDGAREILVPIARLNNAGAVYIFREDGSDFLDGDSTPTPFVTLPSGVVTSPCVGDIDGVPGPEIVFRTLSGALYAFHPDGSEVLDGDSDPTTTGVLIQGGTTSSTRAQPILVDLNGDGPMEIVYGRSSNPLGASLLTYVGVSGGSVSSSSLPMGGATEGAPVAADLDGDGLPEVIVANTPVAGAEFSASGLSMANWEIWNDGLLSRDPEDFEFYRIDRGGPYGAPVMADIDRDGAAEVVVADADGAYHALRIALGSHGEGDLPIEYTSVRELAGWPVSTGRSARPAEVSLGDLEGDGYPEIFHVGDDARLHAFHWNGAPRSGYPVKAAGAFTPADSVGFWAPLVVDVDGDGVRDVVAILPDGRRPAYGADGAAISEFMELGSTGPNAPPIIIDLDGDGTAEWIEVYDSGTQTEIVVRDTTVPGGASSLSWPQFRLGPTRNAVYPTGPAGTADGTPTLTEVYAYPNPSRGDATVIHYRLSDPATFVSVRIYDPAGRVVAELPTTTANMAGSAEHAVSWNHAGLASGLYLGRVEIHSARGTEIGFAPLAVVR